MSKHISAYAFRVTLTHILTITALTIAAGSAQAASTPIKGVPMRMTVDAARNTNRAPARTGDTFTYSDGTQVRATDPSGGEGHVNKDGSISYTDGTHVSHDTKTGVTIVDRPDGTRVVTNPNGPTQTGDTFTFGDGFRIRATDPSGHPGHVNPDGSVSYADGTRVSHDVTSGDTKLVRPDGTVEVTTRNTPNLAGGNYVFGDGYRVLAVDPSGKTGVVKPDGSIAYSDGTLVSHDTVSGDTKVVHPDGSVDVTHGLGDTQRPSGAIGVDGSGNMMWGDGFGVPARDPNGGEGHEIGNGMFGYPDGTTVSHDTMTGDTKIVHPDGSVEFNNARTGEHSVTPGSGQGANNNASAGGTAPVKGSNDSHSNTSSNTSANTSNSNSNTSNTDKPDKTDKEKPDKTDKPDKSSGRIINGDGPGGNGGTGANPFGSRIYNPFAGGPGLDDSPGRPNGSAPSGTAPKVITRGMGPGARPTGSGGTAGRPGPRVSLPSIVLDPDPNALGGGGGRRTIDPYGGRR